MTALVARYPEAVFSDIDFEHEATIWVWPTNDASKHADERQAVASMRREGRARHDLTIASATPPSGFRAQSSRVGRG